MSGAKASTKDLGKARSWYAAAAEKGNVKAMHNLAVSVSAGDKADYVLAAKWYGAAAAFGLADSQYNLGILAEHGLGMAKNPSAAYQWFALAAKNGDGEAAKRRDQVKVQLDPATLAAAEQTVKPGSPTCRRRRLTRSPNPRIGSRQPDARTPRSSPAHKSCSTS